VSDIGRGRPGLAKSNAMHKNAPPGKEIKRDEERGRRGGGGSGGCDAGGGGGGQKGGIFGGGSKRTKGGGKGKVGRGGRYCFLELILRGKVREKCLHVRRGCNWLHGGMREKRI